MNRTRIIMLATVAGNVMNVFFNWVLIFGHLGFPAMGIRGAALGTLLSEALLTGILLVYALRAPAMRRYRILRFRHVERKVVGDIAKVMIPPAVQNAGAMAMFLSYQAIIERLGTETLAVTGLVFAVFRVNKTLVGGFAQGASIIVGNELGAGYPERAEEALWAQEVLSLFIGLSIAVVLVFLPRMILHLFALDPELIPLGVRALRFFAVFFFVEVVGYSLEIVFCHNGWGKLVLISEFSTNVLFMLGATLLVVFVFQWGIYGAWATFAAYQLFHAGILGAGFLSGRWKTAEVE